MLKKSFCPPLAKSVHFEHIDPDDNTIICHYCEKKDDELNNISSSAATTASSPNKSSISETGPEVTQIRDSGSEQGSQFLNSRQNSPWPTASSQLYYVSYCAWRRIA